MRMFSFSSWISESRGQDSVHGAGEHAMADANPKPLLAVQAVAKRKRDDAGDPSAARHDSETAVKRRKAVAMGTPTSTLNSTSSHGRTDAIHSPDLDDGFANMEAISQATVSDALESEMSMQILLTHNELRAIEQNLAKAQIALEQLRRCHLIPYPVTQATPDAMLHVSAGTGPALVAAQAADTRPLWAAPYGVTDGPYSRHYAKWLIPDPSFDGLQLDWGWGKLRAGQPASEGRSTRYNVDTLTPGAKARAQRGSLGQKLQALPSGYTPSKGPAGPSIIKRPDGQHVKLVCLDCRREDFGSTQGFINHCRIAHKREFKSHEEAAVQSGVVVEVDDVGGIVGEEKTPPVATGLVHPLIRHTSPDRSAYATILSRINQSLNKYNQGKLPGITSIPGQVQPPTTNNLAKLDSKFVPSTETPNLSMFLQTKARRGDSSVFTGNLEAEVREAKKKIDLVDDNSEDSDYEKSSASYGSTGLDGASDYPATVMRVPARAPMSPTAFGAPFARPSSSKGPESMFSRKPTGLTSGISPRLPYASPINTSAASNHTRPIAHVASTQSDHSSDEEIDSDVATLDAPSIHDLSPNTITSNNAPSLVSDDGEYDEGDDDAESSIDGSEGEDEGSDVAEIDFEDIDGDDKVLPATALRRRGALRKEEKHVTFVSPVKERRGKARTG